VKTHTIRKAALFAGVTGIASSSLLLSSCGKKESAASAGGYPRKVYAQKIVNRLVKDDKVIKAHEEWKENKALLLPAQMFREGAEEVDSIDDKAIDFTYSLQSTWPLNYENAKKKTPKVEEGLLAVSTKDSEFYGKKWKRSAASNTLSASIQTVPWLQPAGLAITSMKTASQTILNSKKVTSWAASSFVFQNNN